LNALLEQCFIDHRTTSANNPQADGLAERCVQTMKAAIAKYCEISRDITDWDTHMHWAALGYRCSPQAASGVSPYQMLYGVPPTIPPAIKQRINDPIDTFFHEQAAEYVLQRAELLQRHCVAAMNNLLIAQHRDKRRYDQIRSGDFVPRLRRFAVGDFVYTKRRNIHSTLEIEARPEIYRVADVRDSGVLILQGRCGTTMAEHMKDCAPCHLAHIDPTIDPTLVPISDDLPCEVCGSPDDSESMLLCDNCNRGFHMQCCSPPMTVIPAGTWVCPTCVAYGVTVRAVDAKRHGLEPVEAPAARLFVAAPTRRRDEEAAALHGRQVQQVVKYRQGGATLQRTRQGVLQFTGAVNRPYYFKVTMDDGTTLDMTLRTAKSLLLSSGGGAA
jgi:hypothetical protein